MSARHVQRRLLSSAARAVSVSKASAPRFPPPESFITHTEVPAASFNPELWATLQPVPSSALSAFVHRIGLGTVIENTEDVRRACTHPSFLDAYREHDPSAKHTPKTNSQLASFGNSLMGLFAMEYLQLKYPYLPTRVQKAVLTAYVGPQSLASVAEEMGAAQLLKWNREKDQNNNSSTPPVMYRDALASIPRSITALLYQKHSLLSAREFVHSYFLSRQVNLHPMLKFVDPKQALKEMVSKFGREPPKSRLIKETGRFTNSPIYLVGIYSGVDKIGEGYGSSLKMAEFRAAEDALQRVYLTQRPEHEIQLPTSTFPSGLGDVFKSGPAVESSYKAPELVNPEIIYGSSGKSKATR